MIELIDKKEAVKIIDESGDLGEAWSNVRCKCEPILIIPDNPTNGDMIKTLFPNAKIIPNGGLMRFCVKNGVYTFHTDWWNAPYREGEYK